ncbi:MAG TPA: adenylate/guanylate cyclase domain-containing protein [Stellaceae bacterium]|nr:adenylate/guanylate cyclase domain-containing protein [Stellaceae bacterium]
MQRRVAAGKIANAAAEPRPMLLHRLILRILWFTLLGAAAGITIGRFQVVAAGDTPVEGYLSGAAIGATLGLVLSSFEIALNFPWAERLRQAPFLVLLSLRSLVYLGVILASLIGARVVMGGPQSSALSIPRDEFLLSLAVAFGFNLLSGMNLLLGPGVLFNFAAGRYHRPRLETRALLLIDLKGSTAIAERLGERRFLTLLNRFIADVSIAVTGAGGEIHKYVGDEIIATWRLRRASNAAAAIRACFAAHARITARAARYQREFGLTPEFRAALHCGPVVIGELGIVKMEIALIGDAMNTAARIEQACRDTGHPVLASAALIDRVEALPAGITKRALGDWHLRGKEAALALYALDVAAT